MKILEVKVLKEIIEKIPKNYTVSSLVVRMFGESKSLVNFTLHIHMVKNCFL